jgi:hypothetical protein
VKPVVPARGTTGSFGFLRVGAEEDKLLLGEEIALDGAVFRRIR